MIGTISLALTTFLFIGLLPKIFFRSDGEFNLKWILTGAPYFFAPLFVVLTETGVLSGELDKSSMFFSVCQFLAVVLFFASATLMGMTLGTHRVPLALWHQDNDEPASIVTYGAYAKIRHPFYSSFILALIGAFLLSPSFWTLGTLAYAMVALNVTAAREERRLSSSNFGTEYQEYMKNTGRFFPQWA